MVWTRRVLAAVAAVACVGLVAVQSGTAKDPLPEGGATKQQDADLKYLKTWVDTGVKSPKEANKSLYPVRTTALLVAMSAQNRMGGKNDEELAGLRDQMVKLAKALSDDEKPDWAAAAKALEGVKGAKGKKDPVKLDAVDENFDSEVMMDVFKRAKSGGRGWEEDLIDMSQGKKEPEADRVLEIAQGSMLVGQLAENVYGSKAAGATKQKKWTEYAKKMQAAGQEVAAEATKGAKADKATLTKKLEALEASCQACHKEFK
jgi:hypothetical protein